MEHTYYTIYAIRWFVRHASIRISFKFQLNLFFSVHKSSFALGRKARMKMMKGKKSAEGGLHAYYVQNNLPVIFFKPFGSIELIASKTVTPGWGSLGAMDIRMAILYLYNVQYVWK